MFGLHMITTNKRIACRAVVFVVFAFIMMIWLGCGSSVRNGQESFAGSEQAVSEFIEALRREDKNALRAILGPESEELLTSGDDNTDRYRRQQLVKAYDIRHKLEPQGDAFVLVIGQNEWPFPIPLVKQDGQWVFDTAAGKEEIINRRIGRNELNTIQVINAIVDAQREYARQDYDGDGLSDYAQQFRSDSGQKNGLYWPTGENEPPSPLGSLVAQARQADYLRNGLENGVETDQAQTQRPYFGYFYKMLKAQGPDAPGGKYDYIVKGQMMGGFAVVAYPAQYGNSGIMTFIVNHDGRVYQKDLGENTQKEAAAMESFNPDRTWTQVPEQDIELLPPVAAG